MRSVFVSMGIAILATVDAHVNHITSVDFSPNGKTLATGSKDKTIKLWSMAKVLGN